MRKLILFFCVTACSCYVLFPFTQQAAEYHYSLFEKEHSNESVLGIQTIQTRPFDFPALKTETIPLNKSIIPRQQFSAWIPHFDFQNGYNSIKRYKNQIDEVHITGMSIDPNGNTGYSNTLRTNLEVLQQSSSRIGLTVYSASPEGLNTLFTKTSQQFFATIKTFLNTYSNITTLNLNFENMGTDNSGHLVTFLEKLRSEIPDTKITITIFGTNETDEYDYKNISTYTDTIVLMAYDYTLRANKKPGFEQANAPDFWIQEIIEYAKKFVPAEKLAIALPLYGYSFNKSTGKRIKSYTYSQISRLSTRSARLDTDSNEMIAETDTEIIRFQNEQTLNIKLELSKNLGIKQFFYWRLGGENY